MNLCCVVLFIKLQTHNLRNGWKIFCWNMFFDLWTPWSCWSSKTSLWIELLPCDWKLLAIQTTCESHEATGGRSVVLGATVSVAWFHDRDVDVPRLALGIIYAGVVLLVQPSFHGWAVREIHRRSHTRWPGSNAWSGTTGINPDNRRECRLVLGPINL